MQCICPAVSEGVVVYILYLDWFYCWVGKFYWCQSEPFLNIIILDILSSTLIKEFWHQTIQSCPIFLRFTFFSPSAITGFKYGQHFVHCACIIFCVCSSDSSFSMFLPLHPLFLRLLIFAPTGAGLLLCISWRIIYPSVWIVAFASYQTSLRITISLTRSIMQFVPSQ